ncbi:hypothetical protein B0I35DRAFT_476952 [Stachybotrys elegans]|uniref:DUF967 domain protein n=1 Tax=Stachybotrys elegans TaxID=80388 RepID=A0A8K0WUZ3_9HYPO|nr:hypothetical protein B0I35DRAFT_476952 [Stachybotrys elegans]
MSQPILERKAAPGDILEELRDVLSNAATISPDAITSPPETVDALKADGSDSFTLAAFTVADAIDLGHRLHTRLAPLAAQGKPTLINISLASGPTLFQVATGPGVTPDNETWVARKRASVLRFGTSTWLLHCKFGGDEGLFAAKYGLGPEQAGRYAIHGGGVPIRVAGVEGVVAVVVVSGLKQHEDHGVIVDVIRKGWKQV